jgi:hypothetical protein
MKITGPTDLDDLVRQYRLAQHIEKREQEVIPPLDTSAKYLSIKEYAKLLNVSTKAVYRGCAGGAFEGAIKLGRIWRIPVKRCNDEELE